MNWDQMQGTWTEAKGRIKERWGELTDDDLDVINGRRDQLIGRLQKAYGIAREEAEKQVQEFEKIDERLRGRREPPIKRSA